MLVGMELDHPYANVVDTNTSDECIEETMNTSFYSVTESVDTEDTDYMEEDTVLESQPHSQNKYIVFESCLDCLLRFCPQCNHPIEDISKSMQGSLLSVRYVCLSGQVNTWQSQPFVNSMPAGNLLLAGAILFSGSSYTKFANLASILNLSTMAERTFHSIQSKYLFWAAGRRPYIGLGLLMHVYACVYIES